MNPLNDLYQEFITGEKNTPHASITFEEWLRNWKFKSPYFIADLCVKYNIPSNGLCKYYISELDN